MEQLALFDLPAAPMDEPGKSWNGRVPQPPAYVRKSWKISTMHPTNCVECHAPLSAMERGNYAWWCQRCKDPENYSDRLRLAREAATQRCLEAYPFCRECGKRLPTLFVPSGMNRCPNHMSDKELREWDKKHPGADPKDKGVTW